MKKIILVAQKEFSYVRKHDQKNIFIGIGLCQMYKLLVSNINKQDGIFWFDVKNDKQLEISKALSKCVSRLVY